MPQRTAPDDSPVLVVVTNDPADLERARMHGWYRIPLDRAPHRVAAEYLAFYQTGAFPSEERWRVQWYAAVHGYRIVSRCELLPEEPLHPRANERYYRIDLGPLTPLPQPIPSRRLRRISFISTTLTRLRQAKEINDLWIKGSSQERLWTALKAADLEAERQYPLREDLPQYVADFALFCNSGRIVIIIEDESPSDDEIREGTLPDYLLAAKDWTAVRVTQAELAADTGAWMARLIAQVERLGGIEGSSTGQE